MLTPNTKEEFGWEEEFEQDDLPASEPLLAPQEGVVEAAQGGVRLDQWVAQWMPSVSRSEAKRLIEAPEESAEGVRVNGKRERPGYKTRPGDRITLQPAAPRAIHAAAEAIPLAIVYEDADMIVIDKPRGMVTHPAPGATHGTLVNALLAHVESLSALGGAMRPGIVHRLDKDTSGLIMVAKNDAAHRRLQAQIQSRTAERRYLALVWGVPRFERATVEAPVGRHPVDRKKMAVLTDGKHTARPALTELFVRETFAGTFTLLEAKLHTGRTHQIRVHCAYLQHPVVGDLVYGGVRRVSPQAFSAASRPAIERAIADLQGQALHAYALSFDQPRTGERLTFAADPPAPMQTLLDLLHAACTR